MDIKHPKKKIATYWWMDSRERFANYCAGTDYRLLPVYARDNSLLSAREAFSSHFSCFLKFSLVRREICKLREQKDLIEINIRNIIRPLYSVSSKLGV